MFPVIVDWKRDYRIENGRKMQFFDDGELMGIPIKRSTASFQVLLMSSETGLRREKFNLRDNRKLLRIIPNLPEP